MHVRSNAEFFSVKLQVVNPIGKLVNEWVRGGLLGKSVDARVVSGDQVEKMRDNLPKTRAKGEDEMQATMKTQQHKENKLAGTQCTLPACVCLTLQRGGMCVGGPLLHQRQCCAHHVFNASDGLPFAVNQG